VSEHSLVEERGAAAPENIDLPTTSETIDGNFVSAVLDDAPLCCPADQALDTVRLLEAITRSAATGQVVRLA
jgi:predicted dehydrogenase